MAGQSYDRVCLVTAFQTTGGKTFEAPLSVPDGTKANVLEISDLQIRFKIEKNRAKEPNTCELEIVNAAPATRADLCRKPLGFRIAAGYAQDAGPRHLFTGTLRYGQSTYEGTEWTTKLELGDGAAAFDQGRVSKSYAPRTSAITVLRDVSKSMGFSLPAEVEADASLVAPLASGYTAYGDSQQVLSRLLARYGYDWSVQDGRLSVLKAGQAAPGTALEISAETGLISHPQWSSPAKQGENAQGQKLKFEHLLYPQVTPGFLLRVRSRDIDGIFIAERVTHTGDTHSVDEWSTEVECSPHPTAVLR